MLYLALTFVVVKDALVPFLLADCVVLAVFHFIENRIKAQKLAMKSATTDAHYEQDKKTINALKNARREEMERAKQNTKSGPKGSIAHLNPQINQPDKTK